MTLRFTNVDIIADVALKFKNHFRVHVFWDLTFELKSIAYSIRSSEYNIQIYIFLTSPKNFN